MSEADRHKAVPSGTEGARGGGGGGVAFCHRRVMLSILHICYQGWNEHLKFDTLLTGAKFSKQHGNQNGEKKKKPKTAVPAKAQQLGN